MHTLILNASYQPLEIVPAQRAIVLMLDGAAESVAANGRLFRSMNLTVEAASVIRLRQQVAAPFRVTAPVTRRGVLQRDKRRCAYCNRPATTVDHVLPRSRGGRNEWSNVVAACGPCNQRKADRTPAEARMELRVRPRTPHGTEAFALTLPTIDPLWEPWLDHGSAGRRRPAELG